MDGERKIPAKEVVNLVDSDSEDSLEAAEKKRSSLYGGANSTTASTKKARSSSQELAASQREAPIKLLATLVDIEERKKHSSPLDKTCHPSWTQCQTLREMLGLDGEPAGTIDWLVVANYIINFEFLMSEAPELLSIPTVAVFYGSSEVPGSERDWKQAALEGAVDLVTLRPSDPPGSPTNPLEEKFDWGVHHSKIFLVGFSDGRLRVIIHTANLRNSDVHLKAQAAYVQDFPLKTENSKSCAFEQGLISYFATYHYNKRRQWRAGQPKTLVECLAGYDFSSASVVLVPSTPGYHELGTTPAERRGHWKLRHAIAQHCAPVMTKEPQSTMNPIICQFSSVGSLSENYLRQLQDSMDVVSAQRPSNERPGASKKVPLRQTMRLVYPTIDEIRTSVEGYEGGGSVPGRAKNVEKNFLLPLYHKWSGSSAEAGENPIWKCNHVPHIKTYYQIRPEDDPGDESPSMEWFVLTSHNMSKAAWGEIQNTYRGRRLLVRHWELGVFLSPSLLQCNRLMPWSARTQETDDAATVPLPFPLFPRPYGQDDHPWVVDRMYTQADRFGRHSVAG